MSVQARRRQATDRFKHYLQHAAHTGGSAVSRVLGGGSGSSGQDEAAARQGDAQEEDGVALHLKLSPDGRTLTLLEQAAGL